MLQSSATGPYSAPQGHPAHGQGHRAPSTTLRDRFLTELAYYEADKPYHSVDKCAARCRRLSQLLTALEGLEGPHQPR